MVAKASDHGQKIASAGRATATNGDILGLGRNPAPLLLLVTALGCDTRVCLRDSTLENIGKRKGGVGMRRTDSGRVGREFVRGVLMRPLQQVMNVDQNVPQQAGDWQQQGKIKQPEGFQ